MHKFMDQNEPMMRDLTAAERPREKMQSLGVQALSHAELMALFLRTGVPGKSAIQMGRELIHHYGSLGKLGQLGVTELKKFHGLGLGKASQLVAAFELGRRVALEQVSNVPLDCPEKIYEFFAPQMAHLAQEKLVVVVLNAKLHMEAMVEISSGTVNQTLAHPRDILHPVINRNAYAFLVMHNHPSGDPTPSDDDLKMTARIREASKIMQIRFVDHIIIGRPGSDRQSYYSFRESGLV
jgi:DNA repair protein RadC